MAPPTKNVFLPNLLAIKLQKIDDKVIIIAPKIVNKFAEY